MLSVATNVLIATVSDAPDAGMLKDVTIGAVESGKVIVIEAFRLTETFPAASFAHAYNVLAPAAEQV